MDHNTDYSGGINLIWWIIWLLFLVWVFFLPFEIPMQRGIKGTPLDILQKRYSSGQISKDEYIDHKKVLEKDFAK